MRVPRLVNHQVRAQPPAEARNDRYRASPHATSRPSASTASESAELISVDNQRTSRPAPPLDRTADPTARSSWPRSSCTAKALERLSRGARYASSASASFPSRSSRRTRPESERPVRPATKRYGFDSTASLASSGPGTSPCGWPVASPRRRGVHRPAPRQASPGRVNPAGR